MLPVVKTAHLTLRPLRAADIEPLYHIQSDAQAMAYTYIATSLEEFTEHIQAYANLETTLGYAPWAVVALSLIHISCPRWQQQWKPCARQIWRGQRALAAGDWTAMHR